MTSYIEVLMILSYFNVYGDFQANIEEFKLLDNSTLDEAFEAGDRDWKQQQKREAFFIDLS